MGVSLAWRFEQRERGMSRRSEGSGGAGRARRFGVLLACFGLGLLLAVVGLSASSAPSFARQRSYPAGVLPQSVAIGDLNGDGKPDLATANSEANTVSVLANKDRSFEAVDYPTGSFTYPTSVAIGDLNGDGKPDLATANSGTPLVAIGQTVSVFLNRGDGSFQANLDYETGREPRSVTIGDLNGDGKPDLATANGFVHDPGSVSVLLNRGDGSFQANLEYETRRPSSVAIGDLNADGKPDLATASFEADSVSLLINMGNGIFRAGRGYRTGSGPYSVAIGDLNGDGKPDLATANADANSVSVLINIGNESFRARRDYRTGSGPISVVIGDLSGDGKPDLAAANADAGSVSVLVNSGDGSFKAKLDYATGVGPSSVAIGDLNGDSKPDLATANSGADSVSVLVNRPGLCTVQRVTGQRVFAAKRMIARANCRVGKIRRAYARFVKRRRVISQKPKFGAVLPGGSRVNLVVSRGRRR
jgi:FG-GAP-like repeat/FG-GAP repeat